MNRASIAWKWLLESRYRIVLFDETTNFLESQASVLASPISNHNSLPKLGS